MKIGIDIRPLQDGNQSRGIGAYLMKLIPLLVTQGQDDIFFLVVGSSTNLPMDVPGNNVHFIQVNEKRSKKTSIHGKITQRKPILHIDSYRLDVFFQTDSQNFVTSKQAPIVMVAYDLIPLHFKKQEFFTLPKAYRGIGRYKTALINVLRHHNYQKSLRQYQKADQIIAISEATKKDFERHIKLKAPITTVPLAPITDALGKATIYEPSNNLLYIGANEDRKNILFLIEMMGKLLPRYATLKLLLVGHNFGDDKNMHTILIKQLAKDRGIEDSIVFKGFVSEKEKAELYQHAQAFVFPSLYEGFGLPVLEAMQAGCPVVAFNNSSMPEIAGEAAILADSNKEFIEGVQNIITNKNKRKELIEAGYKQVKKFSWEKTTKQTLDILEAAKKNKQV